MPNTPSPSTPKGRFPAESMSALGEAGVWGVLSKPDVGGLGLGPKTASQVIRRVGQECGSTAMVLTMHYCAVNVLEAHSAPEAVRRDCATGDSPEHPGVLRSGVPAASSGPPSALRRTLATRFALDARKSWVTSAAHAQSYVWSSGPITGDGLSSIWFVPSDATGLNIVGSFDGLGLRGNDSSPVTAEGVEVPRANLLGEDGAGFDVMMGSVLPIFQLLNASCSLGLMQSAVQRSIAHASGTTFQHSGSALRDLPTIRAYLARMKVETDMVETLLDDTAAAMEQGRADTMLRVLECKAAAGESATRVLDTAMRVCGGAAFRKDVGVERAFRDGPRGGGDGPNHRRSVRLHRQSCDRHGPFRLRRTRR